MGKIKQALLDTVEGVRKCRIWLRFAWMDIKLRYRRSLLGPFWITISIASMIVMIGLLYSQIFRQDIREFLPYFGISIIFWFYISAMITEGCFSFIGAEAHIKQLDLPASLHVLRLLWRNIIVFFHNSIVMIPLVVYKAVYAKQIGIDILLFPLMFLLVSLVFYFLAYILGIICARYRDVPQIVFTIMQVMMFITPVFWMKKFINDHLWVLDVNPLFHILEILRCPLLGLPFPLYSLQFVLVMLLTLAVIAVAFSARYRWRLPYWV
jgi:ABC-type polysaccharide/polyol phosphate export permease